MNSQAPVERTFDTRAGLVAALAADIVAQVSRAVEARGQASVALSGGSTPETLYDVLAGMAAPWARVSATLSDERWVDEQDPRSNAAMLRRRLLRDRARHIRFVPFKTAQPEPELAEAELDAAIRAMPRPFDLVLLGMGEDGHTASLFPNAQGLAAALDTTDPALVRAVRPGDDGPPRMTLTLRALLDARRIVLLIQGEAKRATLRLALAGGKAAAMPVRAIFNQDRTPVETWWAP